MILKSSARGIIHASEEKLLFRKSEGGYTFHYGILLHLRETTSFAQSFRGKRAFALRSASGEEQGTVLLYGKRKAEIHMHGESCCADETITLFHRVLFPKKEFTFNNTTYRVRQNKDELELLPDSEPCTAASVLFGCLYLTFLSHWGTFMSGETDMLD